MTGGGPESEPHAAHSNKAFVVVWAFMVSAEPRRGHICISRQNPAASGDGKPDNAALAPAKPENKPFYYCFIYCSGRLDCTTLANHSLRNHQMAPDLTAHLELWGERGVVSLTFLPGESFCFE